MNEIESLLKELLAADPSLKDREKELLPILKLLVENKPKAEPTEDFKRRLHQEILLQTRAEPSPSSPSFFSFLSFLMNKNYSVALAGLLLGVIITGPVVYYGLPSQKQTLKTGTPLFTYSVTDTNSNAFGNLSNASGMSRTQSGGGGPTGIGGGGGVAAPMASGEAVSPDQKMIAPGTDIGIYPQEITEYTFKIDGDMPALTQDQVQVLRRNKSINNADAQAMLDAFNLGSIDLSSFGGLKADSVSLYQDQKYGYMLYLSFRDGSVSINQNWEQWPHPESACGTEDCFQRYRMKESDIPADSVLIGIADDFVKAHGIDLAQFGKAEVDNSWRVNYAAATDKAMFWIPDSARVVYPLLIDGKPVYEQGGGKAGISVGVNVREKKVSDLYGIMNQSYARSAYDAVTDSGAVLEYIKSMNNGYGAYPQDAKKKTVEITLGAPEMGYTKVYNYQNGVNDELIVPALIFPVKNVPEGSYFYQQSITVPLAKQLLEQQKNYPVPMPLDAVR